VAATQGLHRRRRYIEDERQNCGEAPNCAALVKERKPEKREFGCNFCDGWRSYVCRRGNHHSRFHVLQVRAEDKALELEVVKRELEHVELGALKGNQGDQNYDLPATVDLNQYQDQAVAILREVSRDIRSGAVGEVLAAQIPEGLTPIEGPEGCRSY